MFYRFLGERRCTLVSYRQRLYGLRTAFLERSYCDSCAHAKRQFSLCLGYQITAKTVFLREQTSRNVYRNAAAEVPLKQRRYYSY